MRRRHLQRKLRDLWTWMVNEVLEHSPKTGAQQPKAQSLPLVWRATSRCTQQEKQLFHRKGCSCWRRSRREEERFDSGFCCQAAQGASVGTWGDFREPPKSRLWSPPHPGQLLLILPEKGMWAGRGKERGLPTLGKLEVFPTSFYDACVFLLVAAHAVRSLQTLLV